MTMNSAMAKALSLTRSGNLLEATATIRNALAMGGAAAPASATEPGGDVIDLVSDRGRWRARNATIGAGVEPTQGATEQLRKSGCFDEHMYRATAGAMAYRLYQPVNAVPGMPLVVMLHGCTQSPEDFARGTGMNRLADELGFLVAYPRQTASANAQKCWNWFRPGDQRRGRGEPALLAGIVAEVTAQHGIDPGRVYVAGLSAGGAAAAILAAEYSDVFAAVGVHSGLACGAARDLPTALAAMQRGAGAGHPARAEQRFVPLITFHGDRDTTVHEVNSREIIAAASALAGLPLTVRVEEGRSASGRTFTKSMSVDPEGRVLIEQWTIHGSGHAWSGGDRAGSYTEPAGPDASREMMRFFLDKTLS